MTKTILIAGATGKTGRILSQGIVEQGHNLIALVRENSDTSQFPESAQLRQADLTDLQSDVCSGADVVVFAAGSGGATSSEMTDKVDRDGAIRLVELAKEVGAERFVMLSTVGADQTNPSGDMAHYLKAKHAADEFLKASGLTFSIIRPVALTDKEPSGDVVVETEVDKSGEASRTDVAKVLETAVTTGKFDGKVLEMRSA